VTEVETLCLACGLCCDGSLFGRVPLAPDDARTHLRVIASGASFEQPCSALVGGACRVYTTRPRACRAFTCKLYERHIREGGPLETRLAVVRRARSLLAAARPGEDVSELRDLLDREFARA